MVGIMVGRGKRRRIKMSELNKFKEWLKKFHNEKEIAWLYSQPKRIIEMKIMEYLESGRHDGTFSSHLDLASQLYYELKKENKI